MIKLGWDNKIILQDFYAMKIIFRERAHKCHTVSECRDAARIKPNYCYYNTDHFLITSRHSV